MNEADARRLLRLMLFFFKMRRRWRVTLSDLPQEVQPGVLLMKRVLAADSLLRERALLGVGSLGASGPLAKAYQAREERVQAGKTGPMMELAFSSNWAELGETERTLLLADGWTEAAYEAFMVFSDGVCDALPQALEYKPSRPRRLLGHFIRCVAPRCECCEPSLFVERQLRAAGSPLVAP